MIPHCCRYQHDSECNAAHWAQCVPGRNKIPSLPSQPILHGQPYVSVREAASLAGGLRDLCSRIQELYSMMDYSTVEEASSSTA